MSPLNNVTTEKATIYQLNSLGTNNWSALIQPALGSDVNSSALASDLALAPKLLTSILGELTERYVELGMTFGEAKEEIENKFPDLLRLNYINNPYNENFE